MAGKKGCGNAGRGQDHEQQVQGHCQVQWQAEAEARVLQRQRYHASADTKPRNSTSGDRAHRYLITLKGKWCQ